MIYLFHERVETDFILIKFHGLVYVGLQIHRDEATGKVLNLVFAWADEGSELKVDVPLVFKGEDVCPGLKKGWFFAFLVLPPVTPVFVYGSVGVYVVVMFVLFFPLNVVSFPYMLT